MKTPKEWVEKYAEDGDGEHTAYEEIAYMERFVESVQADAVNTVPKSRLDHARANYEYWERQALLHRDYVAREACVDANRTLNLVENKVQHGTATGSWIAVPTAKEIK